MHVWWGPSTLSSTRSQRTKVRLTSLRAAWDGCGSLWNTSRRPRGCWWAWSRHSGCMPPQRTVAPWWSSTCCPMSGASSSLRPNTEPPVHSSTNTSSFRYDLWAAPRDPMPQAVLYPACQARVYKSPDPWWWGQMIGWKDEEAEGWAPPVQAAWRGERETYSWSTHWMPGPGLWDSGRQPRPWNMMRFLTWLSMEGGGWTPPPPRPGQASWGGDQTHPSCQRPEQDLRAILWQVVPLHHGGQVSSGSWGDEALSQAHSGLGNLSRWLGPLWEASNQELPRGLGQTFLRAGQEADWQGKERLVCNWEDCDFYLHPGLSTEKRGGMGPCPRPSCWAQAVRIHRWTCSSWNLKIQGGEVWSIPCPVPAPTLPWPLCASLSREEKEKKIKFN